MRNLADTRSLQNVDIPFLAECLYCFEVYHCLEMGEVFDLSLCGKYNLFLFGWQYLSHRNLQKFSRQKSIDQISITTQALQASSETVVCLQKKKINILVYFQTSMFIIYGYILLLFLVNNLWDFPSCIMLPMGVI